MSVRNKSHSFPLFVVFILTLILARNAAAEAFMTAPRCLNAASLSGHSQRPCQAFLRSDSTSLRDGTTNAIETRGGGESTGFFTKSLLREMLAEFIGTFLIVQIGTGSVMSAVFTDSLVGLFQIASVWIIAVTVAICTTASISGAHLNPAISLAFALVRPTKSFGMKKVLPYSLAQLLGAVSASAVNLALYSSSIAAFEGANGIIRASSSGIASAKAFGEYFA